MLVVILMMMMIIIIIIISVMMAAAALMMMIPIEVTLEGIVTDASNVQPWKALAPFMIGLVVQVMVMMLMMIVVCSIIGSIRRLR